MHFFGPILQVWLATEQIQFRLNRLEDEQSQKVEKLRSLSDICEPLLCFVGIML